MSEQGRRLDVSSMSSEQRVQMYNLFLNTLSYRVGGEEQELIQELGIQIESLYTLDLSEEEAGLLSEEIEERKKILLKSDYPDMQEILDRIDGLEQTFFRFE